MADFYKIILTRILSVSLLWFILLGCGTEQASVTPQRVLECAFPDTPTLEAPTWVCDFPVPGVEVSAVGSHLSKAGPSFSKDQAIADGRGKLAGMMRVHVKKMIKRFVETTGQGDSETVDAVFTSVSKNVTKETLFGSKAYRSTTNPETKRIYVLVGFDTQSVVENAKAAIKKAKSSMDKAEAEYQKNLSKEAMQEMENSTEKLAHEVGSTTKAEN